MTVKLAIVARQGEARFHVVDQAATQAAQNGIPASAPFVTVCGHPLTLAGKLEVGEIGEIRAAGGLICEACEAAQAPRCPCTGEEPCHPGYRLCATCLEIAGAGGVDIELYRE